MFDLSDNFKLPLENLKTNQITAHYLLHRITAHASKTFVWYKNSTNRIGTLEINQKLDCYHLKKKILHVLHVTV